MSTKKSFNIPPVPALLLAIISIQLGASIAKIIFPHLGSFSTSALRIVLSAIILFLFNRPNLKSLNKLQWKMSALYGISLGAMNIVFYMAIERIPLGLGIALEFVGPLVLALANSKRALDFLWAVMAASGIALIIPWSPGKIDILGVLLALLAGGLWAVYILVGARVSKIMDGSTAVTVGMLFSSVLILPIAILDGFLFKVTGHFLMLGLALALLSSAIPFSLEMIALKKLPAKTFSVLLSLEPVAGAMFGLIFLNEILSFYEWLAIFLIIVASAGATFYKKNISTEIHG
jgi:inner membrane transporter RhtA